MHWIALQAQPADEHSPLTDATSALGWWALQFTPRVAQVEEALVLELSASERLFGGRRALLRAFFDEGIPVQPLRRAQGATSLVALARLRTGHGSRDVPDDLPLHALSAARNHLGTLERIGCSQWGQLRALPREGVARRFGHELLNALDRAYGLQPEVYPWLVWPEIFEARLELGALVETAGALMFGAHRLLGQLRVWLQARQCGVLALRLAWDMDARRGGATRGDLVLRTAEPTLDMGHMQRLLAEHLARVTLPAPVHSLHLHSLQTAPLTHASASLLPEDLRRGDSLLQTLERLSARLGADHVQQAVACADHRPERMQRWQAAAGSPRQRKSPAAAAARAEALYPSWLLASPLKLVVRQHRPQYQGPLTLLAGPQRLEAGWWDLAPGRAAGLDAAAQMSTATALRDYFIARSPQAGLVWVYRERLSPQPQAAQESASWYLHGLFA